MSIILTDFFTLPIVILRKETEFFAMYYDLTQFINTQTTIPDISIHRGYVLDLKPQRKL